MQPHHDRILEECASRLSEDTSNLKNASLGEALFAALLEMRTEDKFFHSTQFALREGYRFRAHLGSERPENIFPISEGLKRYPENPTFAACFTAGYEQACLEYELGIDIEQWSSLGGAPRHLLLSQVQMLKEESSFLRGLLQEADSLSKEEKKDASCKL